MNEMCYGHSSAWTQWCDCSGCWFDFSYIYTIYTLILYIGLCLVANSFALPLAKLAYVDCAITVNSFYDSKFDYLICWMRILMTSFNSIVAIELFNYWKNNKVALKHNGYWPSECPANKTILMLNSLHHLHDKLSNYNTKIMYYLNDYFVLTSQTSRSQWKPVFEG